MYPAAGGPPVLLTGPISEEGMQSGDLNNARLIEFPPLIDAPGLAAEDFLNESNSLTFTIQRTWDTPGDAAAYWLTHMETLPRTGKLRMRAEQPGGTVVLQRWLPGAGIPSVRGTFSGCETTFTYQVIGGVITATEPT